VLDAVTDQLARLQRGLGPRDRSKIEQYLEATRDIERLEGKLELLRADLTGKFSLLQWMLGILLAGVVELLLLLYKPNFTWPGLLIVLLGIPVYFVWKKREV